MNEAILIFDMPKSCTNCPCYNYQKNECNITKKHIPFQKALKIRMSWCPIQENKKPTD